MAIVIKYQIQNKQDDWAVITTRKLAKTGQGPRAEYIKQMMKNTIIEIHQDLKEVTTQSQQGGTENFNKLIYKKKIINMMLSKLYINQIQLKPQSFKPF